MKILIKCLTDGARVAGEALRASQVVYRDLDDEQVMRLRVGIAAGDFVALDGLEEPAKPAPIAAKADKGS